MLRPGNTRPLTLTVPSHFRRLSQQRLDCCQQALHVQWLFHQQACASLRGGELLVRLSRHDNDRQYRVLAHDVLEYLPAILDTQPEVEQQLMPAAKP
ncbi:MAG: hypothetical protein IH623_23195 [Verrucomicrobia bacterium]|nr:hypothetical protein [Verrucomicrobiota bacterium]